jgi:hypothetical protein
MRTLSMFFALWLLPAALLAADEPTNSPGLLMLDFGSPKQLERAMESSRRLE